MKPARPVAEPRPQTVDEYIAAAPATVQPLLQAVRATIRRLAPQAQEHISYRMPAYRLGKVLIYFAAFKHHIGLYPPVRDAALQPLLAPYAGPKGNLRFPLSEPLALDIIERIVQARIQEVHNAMPNEPKVKGPASYFPSIEKKYEKPMAHWFALVAQQKARKHMEVVEWLKTEHGLGHGHANAIVAHCRAQQE